MKDERARSRRIEKWAIAIMARERHDVNGVTSPAKTEMMRKESNDITPAIDIA